MFSVKFVRQCTFKGRSNITLYNDPPLDHDGIRQINAVDFLLKYGEA